MGSSLKDVAALAGVSVKTVSNVVNGYAHVRPLTRSRVQEALEELNYRPNLSARNLRYGRSGVIALALPELDMPYFAELAGSVVRCAEAQGWTVLIDQTDGQAEREHLVLAGIRAHLIDGLILSPLAISSEDLAQRTDDTPLVLLGERIHGGSADHVTTDNVAAARTATAHLADLGRRRIAAMGAQQRSPGEAARLRLTGYRQALEAAGLPVIDELAARAEAYHREDGARAMRELLELPDPPDAVFCFNDLLALGALRTLLDRGVRVPEDVALVGFDDIEDGRFSTPTLTTIAPDKAGIAAKAVELLVRRLGDDVSEPREAYADFTLLARESTLGRPR